MQTLSSLINTISGFPYWEQVAVVLAIGYLLLAVKESIWCWHCAFFSTAIYIFLFFDVSLFMESALNVYYLVMAVYGYWQWKKGGPTQPTLTINRWRLQTHVFIILGIVAISLTSGYLLKQHSTAALPFLDSFTTWASVVTTYMVAKKVLENWLYWIVIDSLSIYLYIERGLTTTAWLFAAYVVIACFGFFSWYKHYQQTLVQPHHEKP